MFKKKFFKPSSEDELSELSIKEATDKYFLQELFTSNAPFFIKSNSSKNDLTDIILLENSDLNNNLSQSSRDFISKKMYKRLERYIFSDNHSLQRKLNCNKNKYSGIKLLSSSSVILKKVHKNVEMPRKKFNSVQDEEKNFFKCKEVAIKSEIILSQQDTKFWIQRKSSKEFKYKIFENGTLLEINEFGF